MQPTKLSVPQEPSAWGIKPLNKEQRFAMELLLDDNIDLVTLVGTAGTGKTYIIACGGRALKQVMRSTPCSHNNCGLIAAAILSVGA